MYHLPYAKAFVESGGVPFLPDLRFPVFPQLNELLFAGAFLLGGGESGAHLVQLAVTLATAALVGVWGRQAFSPAGGWLAAATFLGSPLIVGLAVTGYVETALALFTTAALYAVWRWRASGKIGWLALADACAASAAGVKYLGLFFVGLVVMEAAMAAWRDRALRPLLLTSLVLAAILVPTYGRILFYTGNPVFPFFSGLFGSSPWEGGRMLGGETLPGRVAGLLTLPWDAVFHRESTGAAPPLSPAFLLGIPLLLLGALWDERIRWPVLVTAVYSLVYLVLARDVRYLAAVLPVLSMALGGILSEFIDNVPPFRGRARVWAAVLAFFLFLPGWLYASYRIACEGPVPLTSAARDRYLARQLPAYSALAWLNRARGSGYTVYALHSENMVYFAEGRFLGDAIGPANFFRILPLLGHPAALHRELGRLGADHLLVIRGKGSGLPDTPEARRLFHPVYEDVYAVIYRLG
jgi:4-amino-4-deoxy-L-arabinose transferase-like glycosyltransferase